VWALTTHNTRCDPAALLIEANLDELGVSVAEAAKGMKVTRQQLYNVMCGRSAASPDMALRLEQALGGSASMWMGMQSAYELAQACKEQVKLTIRCLGERRVTMPALT
jgi:addiction module HigA family antidote